MAEYIEREAAQTECKKYKFSESYDAFVVDCILKSIPAADVAPVRHGRWVLVEQRFYHGGFVNLFRCSECKVATDTGSNYCPN